MYDHGTVLLNDLSPIFILWIGKSVQYIVLYISGIFLFIPISSLIHFFLFLMLGWMTITSKKMKAKFWHKDWLIHRGSPIFILIVSSWLTNWYFTTVIKVKWFIPYIQFVNRKSSIFNDDKIGGKICILSGLCSYIIVMT